jgi:hypothetical protein
LPPRQENEILAMIWADAPARARVYMRRREAKPILTVSRQASRAPICGGPQHQDRIPGDRDRGGPGG